MESTDTTQSMSHTSDIYLLAKSRHWSNYSELSSSPQTWSHTQTHTPTHLAVAEDLKTTKDRCVSKPHFIIHHGMQHGGDGVGEREQKSNNLILQIYVCMSVLLAWHYVLWFWVGCEKQNDFLGIIWKTMTV